MIGHRGGRATAALVDRPPGPAFGTVVALHGFTRAPGHLGLLAAACADAGLACIRPALAPRWVPVLMARPRHLETVADDLLDALDGLPGPVVLVGHSAGGAAACWIAARWRTGRSALVASAAATDAVACGRSVAGGGSVAGIVLVDGVDSVTSLIRRSLPVLADVPMTALVADPSPCNRHGALARYLDRERPGVTVRMPGTSHGDIEGQDHAVYRLACGERSSQAMRQQVIDRAVASALGMACS